MVITPWFGFAGLSNSETLRRKASSRNGSLANSC